MPLRIANLAGASGAVVALCVLLAGCAPLDPGTIRRTSLADGIEQSDALLKRLIPADGPGCSAAVAIDGEIAWAGQGGLADVDAGIPIGPDTRFDFASVSKQFTGLTILRLADAGMLRVSDPVSRYLYGLPTWSHDVTIDELLHHTSGIPHYTSLLISEGFAFEDTTTQADALKAIGRAELQSPAGERFAYSNSNYVLLASIVESVTGEKFAAVVKREAIGEAALEVDPASTAADVALGYQGGKRSASGWLQVGDGSIIGTPTQLSLWADFYRHDDTDAAVRPMTQDAVAWAAGGGINAGIGGNYGAGIFIEADGALSHGGAWGGFLTKFDVSADRSTAVTLSCNSPDLAFQTISTGLLRVWK